MNQDKSSHSHNGGPEAGSPENHRERRGARSGWDATAPFLSGFDLWTRLTFDQLGRMQSFCDEMVDIESEIYERSRRSGRELTAMAEQTMTYMTKMTAEWQELSLQAMRRSREILAK